MRGMPAAPATYKDLCIDAHNGPLMARFWASALRLGETTDRGNVVHIAGPTNQQDVWVCVVPEPKTAKNRLHLDVHTGSIDELVELGATVLQTFPRWTVMADPEGGEFCAFVREQVPQPRLFEIVLDALDAPGLARWWAELLGGTYGVDTAGWPEVSDIPGAPFEWLCVNPTDEPKTAKNRVHVDVTTNDLEAIVAHGATLLRPRGGDIAWNVLADPEGNEFCAFTP